MTRKFFLSLLFFCSISLFAQEDTIRSNILDEVIITATRISVNRNSVPMTVSVVNRENIEESSETATCEYCRMGFLIERTSPAIERHNDSDSDDKDSDNLDTDQGDDFTSYTYRTESGETFRLVMVDEFPDDSRVTKKTAGKIILSILKIILKIILLPLILVLFLLGLFIRVICEYLAFVAYLLIGLVALGFIFLVVSMLGTDGAFDWQLLLGMGIIGMILCGIAVFIIAAPEFIIDLSEQLFDFVRYG